MSVALSAPEDELSHWPDLPAIGEKTRIDCHKGIAHKLPKEYKDPDEE